MSRETVSPYRRLDYYRRETGSSLLPMLETASLAKRVNLDAMIPRADFGDISVSSAQERIPNFTLGNLEDASPIFLALRKPDFQRETNHWTSKQVVDLIESFLDDELVPALILWDSTSFMFVIDGGHRLSALRAWMADDYGDGEITKQFYNGMISDDQKKVAKATRALVEQRIGRFGDLKRRVATAAKADDVTAKRANRMFRRALTLQWVSGSQNVAESSFYKINSQGTPLDAVETSLIKNRRKPIAISARAIIRAGEGHKYWADFSVAMQERVVKAASELYTVLFEPEIDVPVKTLDVPLGGSVSPVDALALLIEFLSIAGRSENQIKQIQDYDDDPDGQDTADVLDRTLKVVKRFTTNAPGSLGLHPAVYYYSDKGKHSRFLFLGMIQLISQHVINNNSDFFISFTKARGAMENFLIDNKSLITSLLQNLNSRDRVSKMRDLFAHLVNELSNNRIVSVESALTHLGVEGKVYNLSFASASREFSEDTKSTTYVKRAIESALRCSICHGLLDTTRSVSYDHMIRKADGGKGDVENCDLTHPFCNTAIKNTSDQLHDGKKVPDGCVA